MVIKNKRKKVLVFKAYGQPVLRLLPGLNEVDADDMEHYFKDNPAAQAMADESLDAIKGTLTAAEKAEAVSARQKNEKLNKSAILLKRAQNDLHEARQAGAKSSKTDGKKIASLEKDIGELKEQLKTALAGIEAQQKATVVTAAEKDLEEAQEVLKTAEANWDTAEVGEPKQKASKAKDAAAKAVKTAEKAVAEAKGE